MRSPLIVAALCIVVGAVTLSGQRGEPPMVRRAERARRAPGSSVTETITPGIFEQGNGRQDTGPRSPPNERRLERAGSFDGDLRALPERPVRKRERPEREGPEPAPIQLRDPNRPDAPATTEPAPVQSLSAPAPGPSASFEGLDFATWGAGHPPDTNGDVGSSYYIQTVNTSIGVYDKNNGTRVAAFTFDTFMSQGHFGNLCDTDNFGDPVVLYDTFEDRWVITDFAFTLDGSGNVINPPGAFECFAVSKSSDPIAGGWNFYSINTAGGLGDYPKLGIWPDGLYMSVNMFDYAASGSFQNVRLYALNKSQMYAGAASVQVVTFDLPASEFTLLPSNARLQTGTPPTGAPNYFASIWSYLNVVSIWKFHVDWNSIGSSSLTGPFNSITPTNWSQLTSGTVPSPGNRLDTLYPRLMVQNQYSNLSGVESLWNAHTVGASGTSSAQSGVRYYELHVTGDTVAANTTQSFTYSPDTTNRFMPSVGVDRAGNMAIGYSATSATVMPALRYAGRLAADAANTITQTEATLLAGAGTQTGLCGGASCERWGDYSAMTLDVDGCKFWYSNEYYQTSGLNNRTRIGAFSFGACTPVSVGTLQGTVKTASAQPIAGATVTLGSRTTTTDALGQYSFADLAAGTYPISTASFTGFTSGTFTSIVIASGSTTTRDFVLSAAAQSGCFTDTTQADFQSGASTNCDVAGTPGSVTLSRPINPDQQNLSVTSSGFSFSTTSWAGQTFTPAVTGLLSKIDLDLFCSGCTGTTPNLTVSIRATSGSPLVPTGPDLAVATIAGFSSGAGGFFTATFASPATLTAGTRYAVTIRPVAAPSAGSYAYVCSCGNGPANTNPYLNGQRVTSTNSGGTWVADTSSGGRDLGFIAYMQSGFAGPGTFISATKDANPVPGAFATWGNLSWTATVPAGTTLQFQAAASNSIAGPFAFVGSDGTASTFFTSGASLAQFNGRRYLKYRAVLTTTNAGATPSIQDVTICFNDIASPTVSIAPASVTFAGKRRVGTTSPPATPIVITNNGPGALVFTAFNGSAPTASFTTGADFPTTTNCPLGVGGLASGASCQFTASFAPTVAGTRNATLTIATNASNSPHTASLSGLAYAIDDGTVASTVVMGASRLQQLQNADGGWYFRATDTDCGAGAGVSCPNLIGDTALSLLTAYDRNQDPAVLADAVQSGQLLTTLHSANPSRRPFTQDLEFLVALTTATGDPQYASLATTWFSTITAQYPVAADKADAMFASRSAQNLRTLAVWDLASIIRMAKAAGNVAYASGIANRVIAREADWKDVTVAHRWDQCADTAGCGPVGNKLAFDHTLLGMGSMLWAMHDLPGFDTKIGEYRSWLLSQQDATGTWDVGDLQITSFDVVGLAAVGGTGTNTALQNAVGFYIENQLANSGWPFSIVNGVSSREYSSVDAQIIRAVATLFGTPSGQAIAVVPAQLATVTFDRVDASGSTTVVALPSDAPLPFGYQIANGLTYEVTTSATVTGPSTVCFSPALLAGLSDVRILHKESGVFVDRTTVRRGGSSDPPDPSAACAQADSLSTYAIATIDPNAVDSEAPQLSVTLSPSVLSPANNKMLTVTATITVTDSADPNPAITLVSITIGGGDNGKKDDIEDAAIGSDDRSFRLRAEKVKGGRVYTIVYRATDRSGNFREVTREVVVQ